MKNLPAILVIPLVLGITLCASCANHPTIGERPSLDHAENFDAGGYSSEPGDFVGVTFKSAEPSGGQQLVTALSEPAETALSALRYDLKLLEQFPKNIAVRVVGFTDTAECSGRACIDLSEVRARAVHDWLISNGISAARLEKPHGFGAARPVGDNTSEEGRARNRRAYISYGPIP
ncbi:OmpA family protein [Chiayiivirga flava]|uniref:OOP family OmpA-OmpF porin n=1 Tax=Chiayiivirga flava TaxID=659595 RepID=A0A7W8G319_9GAMM|nr:OmpA family protein [Chiayiivirga flava]MBB5209270.1 OOP family OmpA-OmpF porin [Chiayiivirga flava]